LLKAELAKKKGFGQLTEALTPLGGAASLQQVKREAWLKATFLFGSVT